MSKQGKFSKGRRSRGSKVLPLLLALVLLTGTVAGTLAYLLDSTEDVVNTFTPANVPNTPVEEFNGTVKSSIKVQVTGNIAAYIRVKLVTYRVDENNNHIGGTATIPPSHWALIGSRRMAITTTSSLSNPVLLPAICWVRLSPFRSTKMPTAASRSLKSSPSPSRASPPPRWNPSGR